MGDVCAFALSENGVFSMKGQPPIFNRDRFRCRSQDSEVEDEQEDGFGCSKHSVGVCGVWCR